MMAYGDGYALCVLHDGSPVREIHGKVSIPYHSEYKVRLKNKNNVRAKARVWIDGRKVSNLGDFILHAGETLDLERFLDSSMSHGNRFKFVPLSDSRVNDPTDSENGIIKVAFYSEVARVIIRDIPWHLRSGPQPCGASGDYTDTAVNCQYTPNFDTGGNLIGSRTTTSSQIKSGSSSVKRAHAANYMSQDTAGATVEGSNSNQQFTSGDYFETETSPTVLTLRIKATEYRRPAEIAPDSRPRPTKERYCRSCGRRRQRVTDKFCPRCGVGYQRQTRKRRRRPSIGLQP